MAAAACAHRKWTSRVSALPSRRRSAEACAWAAALASILGSSALRRRPDPGRSQHRVHALPLAQARHSCRSQQSTRLTKRCRPHGRPRLLSHVRLPWAALDCRGSRRPRLSSRQTQVHQNSDSQVSRKVLILALETPTKRKRRTHRQLHSAYPTKQSRWLVCVGMWHAGPARRRCFTSEPRPPAFCCAWEGVKSSTGRRRLGAAPAHICLLYKT